MGIDEYPTDVREGLSHSEKIDLAYKLNMQRRHFDEPGVKRERVKEYLREHWDGESKSHAAEVTGSSRRTVSRALDEIRQSGKSGQVPEFTTRSERRKAIREAIEENPEASNREIADRLGVSHPTVGNVRQTFENPGDPVPSSVANK